MSRRQTGPLFSLCGAGREASYRKGLGGCYPLAKTDLKGPTRNGAAIKAVPLRQGVQSRLEFGRDAEAQHRAAVLAGLGLSALLVGG